MPTAPVIGNHGTHDYAERIRERLPRGLQELRKAMGLTNVRPDSGAWHQLGIHRQDQAGSVFSTRGEPPCQMPLTNKLIGCSGTPKSPR